MMGDELLVLLAATLVGRISRDRRQRFQFVYESAWREAPDSFPLSLSLPLAASTHAHDAIEAFMWGLLPDNEQVLDRWAKRFQVSARNAFALISHVGEDCAGAVQFVRPERLSKLVGTGPVEVDWLTEHDIATRLRSLREDHASWRMARDTGQFSLAGAQPKTALFFKAGRWGVPSGRTPTTHILKPPTGELDGHAENEHLCLALARELGIPTADSRVQQFEDEKAIVVERYDRIQVPRQGVMRVHQEDMCQAMGVLPTLKYQSEGGPTPESIVELLRVHSSRSDEDISTFVDALIFSWLVAGTDGHAKNYSLLLEARGQVRLAPLYDLGSALPYLQFDQRRLKLAMKIGGSYRVRDIASRHFHRFATNCRLEPKAILTRAKELAGMVLERAPSVCQREEAGGLRHPIVGRTSERVVAHATRCQLALASPP